MQNDRLHKEKTLPQPHGNQATTDSSPELVQELRARVDEQAKMISYLQSKLDKVPALPAPKPESQQPLNRWQALRALVLGR